jgi:hypothetical protein
LPLFTVFIRIEAQSPIEKQPPPTYFDPSNFQYLKKKIIEIKSSAHACDLGFRTCASIRINTVVKVIFQVPHRPNPIGKY